MAQGTKQHGAGIVILQPAGVRHIDAALLDRFAEFEKAISTHFDYLDHPEGIVHFGDQQRVRHLTDRGETWHPPLSTMTSPTISAMGKALIVIEAPSPGHAIICRSRERRVRRYAATTIKTNIEVCHVRHYRCRPHGAVYSTSTAQARHRLCRFRTARGCRRPVGHR